MTDRYIAFANSPVGRRLVGAVGLPLPAAHGALAGRPGAPWTARW